AKINIASSDFTIGKLDSDVPEGIGFYKIPPSGFLDYIPGISNGIHCCGVDQEEKMLVVDLKRVNGLLVFDFPHDAQSLAFNEKIITGDSGNPVFAIINGELVLLTVWTYGNGGAGYPIWQYKDSINAA